MTFGQKGRLRTLALPLSAAVVLLFPAMTLADAASEAALEQEIKYINALSDYGYVDFAPAAIAAAQRKWPDAKGVLEAVTIRAELNAGKQEQVAKKIAARPDQNSLDTWLLKLELASSYARFNKYNEADALYKEFFKRFPKVSQSVRKTYVEAAYGYILMLEQIDRRADALPYYKLAMEQSPNQDVMKDFRARYLKAILAQAEAMPAGKDRDARVKEADELARKMVWNQDTYFGDAINGMAHVKMLRGDVKGAQEMIKEYLPDLMNIHKQLKEQDPDGGLGILRLSPLPQCRYLIGTMLYDQAKAEAAKAKPNEDVIKNLLLGERDPKTKKRNGQGAFNHLVNVYVNYPESQSAAAAGDTVEAIRNLIQDRYNTTLKVNVSDDQRAKVRQQQYVEANVKFNAGQWAEAAEAYSKTISQYGLNAESLTALANMAECYIQGGVKGGKLDPMARLYAETVTAALAEGFSGVPKLRDRAGDAVRKLADYYGEIQLRTLQDETQQLFFRFYPSHPASVTMQLKVAEEKAKAGDVAGAEELYAKVAEAASGDDQRLARTAALLGLLKMVQPNGAKPDPEKELAAAKRFAEHFDGIARPGAPAAVAQFFLAEAHRHQAEALRKAVKDGSNDKAVTAGYGEATKIYRALAQELAKKENIYASTAKEAEENAQILENALYMQGVCMQRLPSVGNEAKDKAFKAAAMKFFQRYLERFPKGRNAASAMLQIGTLQAAAGDIEASRATLDQLAKTFPDSEQAKNSIPMLADSLYQMGMRGEAINTYKRMFAAGGDYTPGQYLSAGEKLLAAGEAKLAVEACDAVLKAQNAKAWLPQAMLLRTRALLADKQPEAAYRQITEMLEKYGKTRAALDANLALIEVAGEQVLREKDFSGRNALLRKTLDAVSFVTSRSRAQAESEDPAERKAYAAMIVRLRLSVAEVAEKAYRAEAEAKGENARAILGDAINAYRTAITSAGDIAPTDDAVSANIQKAYLGSLRLTQAFAELETDAAAKKEVFRDIVAIGEEYLGKFPNGTYRTDVTNAITQARIEAGE